MILDEIDEIFIHFSFIISHHQFIIFIRALDLDIVTDHVLVISLLYIEFFDSPTIIHQSVSWYDQTSRNITAISWVAHVTEDLGLKTPMQRLPNVTKLFCSEFLKLEI